MGHGYRPLISKIRIHNPNKTGSKKANYNYLHYIATREGVDLTRINSMDDLVQENVDLNSTEEETVYNHANDVDYLKYMSYRPRSHGLFGNIETENFSDVSKKINAASAQKKNIYRGIISLSGQDAKTLGYNSADKWDVYLKSVMPDIALTLGLSPNNMTWVAAFHAEDAHPHVHYMLWDNRDVVKSHIFMLKRRKLAGRYARIKCFRMNMNLLSEAFQRKREKNIIRNRMKPGRISRINSRIFCIEKILFLERTLKVCRVDFQQRNTRSSLIYTKTFYRRFQKADVSVINLCQWNVKHI